MAIDPTTGALTSRIQRVYNCPQLNLFFITGQPTSLQRFDGLGARSAGIACRPYHTLAQDEFNALSSRAEKLEESHVDITVMKKARMLELNDRLTKVVSTFPFDSLDPAIRTRLDGGSPGLPPSP